MHLRDGETLMLFFARTGYGMVQRSGFAQHLNAALALTQHVEDAPHVPPAQQASPEEPVPKKKRVEARVREGRRAEGPLLREVKQLKHDHKMELVWS